MVTLSCRETEQHCRFLQLGSVTFYIIGTFSISPACHSTVPIGNANPNRKKLASDKFQLEDTEINIDLNTTSEYREQHSLLSIQLCNFHLSNQYLPLIQS